MRTFDPLPADHPLVTDIHARCGICHDRFRAAEIISLVPVDLTGEGGTVPALPVHTSCARRMMDPNDDVVYTKK